MPKVLCKLPNASTKINGFNFVKHRDGMISEELDQADADHLASITGYEIYDPTGTDPAAQAILEAARKQRESQQQQTATKPPLTPTTPGTAAQQPTPPAPSATPTKPETPSTSSTTPPVKPPVAPEPQF